MTDAVEDHEGTVSIRSRAIANLRFADDIDGLAGEEELVNLVERLDKASTAYSNEISAEKAKLMTNNTSNINTEIKMNRQKLETVTSFKYLGSAITDEGSKSEILSRISQTTAALTRLKPGLAKTILQGTVKGGRRHGIQRKRWEDNMDRPGVRLVPEGSREQGKVEETG